MAVAKKGGVAKKAAPVKKKAAAKKSSVAKKSSGASTRKVSDAKIRQGLLEAGGSPVRAAHALGIAITTIYRRLKHLGITPPTKAAAVRRAAAKKAADKKAAIKKGAVRKTSAK